MNVELGILNDGGLMLVSDGPLPNLVKRVEFFRDQRLFMLVYDDDNHEGDLMHYEVPQDMTAPVEKSPDVVIYSVFKDHEPIGYKVPLIKVGALY